MGPVSHRAHPFQREGHSLIVPVTYVPFQAADEFVRRLELLPVEHLDLQPSEEALHRAVVKAVALPRHALDYAMISQLLAELPHLVLPALVGVQYRRRSLRKPLKKPFQHLPRLRKARA